MIIDAHQHVWNLEQVEYPWITPALKVLNRSYSFAELEPQLDACGVQRTVLVQAASSVAETRWLQAVADAHPRVAAIVAWAPLDDPTAAAIVLDEYAEDPRIVGVRHLADDDPEWLEGSEVRAGLAMVEERGLTYDIAPTTDRQLQQVAMLASEHPSLKIVVDHLAKPPIAESGWLPWADSLARVAEYPSVFAKLSGLNTAASAAWTASDFAPYVEHAFINFGAERIMFGSDWPVALLSGDYGRVWDATLEMLEGRTAAEREAVLGATAAVFYGI